MKLQPEWVPAIETRDRTPGFSRDRRFATALVLGVVFWLLAWYGDTAQSMVAIWIRSETFAHGFLIVPITAWLIWRKRFNLAALELRPNFFVLPVLALVGFGWLLGHLSGTGIVQQYGLVLMIPLLVWTILGHQVVRALVFPFFFLLFAVPFGEFLVPPMMSYTADFAILALRLTGVPVYREGLFFVTPTGNWSVVEACAGLRYLIASLTLGFLYAYLTYRSLVRRAVFIAFSVIVPIVANWLRAYMIVMIGHLTDMKYAAGVDHLIYGWIFFGVVMLILFFIGSFWREDHAPRPAAPGPVAYPPRKRPSLTAIMAAAIASAAVVAVWPGTLRLGDTGPYVPPVLQAPPPAGGWQTVEGRLTGWTPRFLNPSTRINQAYAGDGGRAGLYIGYYRNQRESAELITSGNTLVHGSDRIWRNVGATRRTSMYNDEKVPLIETRLHGQGTDLLVWHWYWVDGRYTASPYWAKLFHAKSRLLGRGDDGAVVIVYTQLDTDRKAAAGRLHDFVSAMLPAVARSLDDARRP